MTDKIEKQEKEIAMKGRFIAAIGRRKTATAQVRAYKKGTGVVVINNMKASQYFSKDIASTIKDPVKLVGLDKELDFSIVVKGGGKNGQADAIKHGISRILVQINEELRPTLNAKGLLTRDARRKERKKPGLKRARKAPQWAKR